MLIPYDPTRAALYRPESGLPVPMDTGWTIPAIAAECARLAYRRFESDPAEKACIATAVAAAGYAATGWFDLPDGPRPKFDAQGFAARNEDGRAIIAFRGTQADSLLDLVTDASFTLERWEGGGHVHSGFWESLQSILDQIETWLDLEKPDTLIVTGHSLGAAMATLLAAKLAAHFPTRLITFGSPRVGDAAFVASLGQMPIHRYVDCTDAVTQVPPPPFFQHVAGLHYIDKDGKIHAGEQPDFSLLADQLQAVIDYAPLMWRRDNVHLRALADHAPINYLSAVLGARI